MPNEKPPILNKEAQLGVFAHWFDEMENPAPEIDDALCEAQRDDTWQKATLIYEAKIERVKRDIFNKTVQAAEHRERFVIEQAKRETARQLYDEIICPMCYRLNPQHATMDNGKGCHTCEEKECWCKNLSKSDME